MTTRQKTQGEQRRVDEERPQICKMHFFTKQEWEIRNYYESRLGNTEIQYGCM